MSDDTEYVTVPDFEGHIYSQKLKDAIKFEVGGGSTLGVFKGSGIGPKPTDESVILVDQNNVVRKVRAPKGYERPACDNTYFFSLKGTATLEKNVKGGSQLNLGWILALLAVILLMTAFF